MSTEPDVMAGEINELNRQLCIAEEQIAWLESRLKRYRTVYIDLSNEADGMYAQEKIDYLEREVERLKAVETTNADRAGR